jgi:hypothetical protein
MTLPLRSADMVARVLSMTKVPIRGPLPLRGVVGELVDCARNNWRFAGVGVAGEASRAAMAARLAMISFLAVISSSVSSSVVSPPSSSLAFVSKRGDKKV